KEGIALPMPPGPLSRLLAGESLAAVEFAELDDMDVWVALKAWSKASDPVLAELADGLVRRRLFKTADLDPAPESIAAGMDAAREVVARHGLDPDYHLRLTRAEDTPYRPYDPDSGGRQRPILINVRGRLERIEEVSHIAQLLGRDSYRS